MDLSGLKFGSSSTYTILSEIGRGGMGIVFLAEKDCEGVTDLVALKTIRAKSATLESFASADAIPRQEGKSSASLEPRPDPPSRRASATAAASAFSLKRAEAWSRS